MHSGSASDSESRSRVRSPPGAPYCVLEDDRFHSPVYLLMPSNRWLCPDMTEKLLTGTLNLKTKQTWLFLTAHVRIKFGHFSHGKILNFFNCFPKCAFEIHLKK